MRHIVQTRKAQSIKCNSLVVAQVSIRLCESYQTQYRLTRDRLLAQPKAKQFDFDEKAIFFKFDLLAKRLHKLTTMFTTIHQFSSLAHHTHIDGLDLMIKNFHNIVDDVKRKPYDLLDYCKTQFDRDFLEFNVNIHDLEMALQVSYRRIKEPF